MPGREDRVLSLARLREVRLPAPHQLRIDFPRSTGAAAALGRRKQVLGGLPPKACQPLAALRLEKVGKLLLADGQFLFEGGTRRRRLRGADQRQLFRLDGTGEDAVERVVVLARNRVVLV